MYSEGTIIYFTPFYFKNGGSQKKFFVVLKVEAGKSIIASLPTKKDSIPEANTIKAGCVELPDINLNCFVIEKEVPITDCNKSFELQTHIYGHQLDSYEVANLKDVYRIEGVDYEIFGKMKPEFFNSLIECLKNSKSVRKKFVKSLTSDSKGSTPAPLK